MATMRKHFVSVLVACALSLSCQTAGAQQTAWDIERVKDTKGNIIALKIFKKGQKSLHQELRGFVASPPDFAVKEGFDVQLKDINFDGYKDILVYEFLPANPNVPYLYWLYNPVSDKFECRDPDPDDKSCRILNPDFDYEKKQVIQLYTDSATTHGTRFLTWEDGKLVLVKEVEEEMDASGRTKVTVTEQKNGKPVVTKKYIK
jgi:hypothetical protein